MLAHHPVDVFDVECPVSKNTATGLFLLIMSASIPDDRTRATESTFGLAQIFHQNALKPANGQSTPSLKHEEC